LTDELRPVGIEGDLFDFPLVDEFEELGVSHVLDVSPRSLSHCSDGRLDRRVVGRCCWLMVVLVILRRRVSRWRSGVQHRIFILVARR